MDPVADSAEDLTCEWLTAALHSAGHGLVVAGVQAERIGTGQMGATYRLRLRYHAGTGPAALVAKLAAGDAAMRRRVAVGYAAEVGFYQHIASTVDVCTPRCWYAAIVHDHTALTLLLDDAAPATVGVQQHGCTVAQARLALRNLVGLHAPRWNDHSLRGLRFLTQPDEARAVRVGDMLVPATEGFVQRYAMDLRAEEVATLREVARVIRGWHVSRPEHFTVLHGDYRLDNLMFTPSSRSVIAVDWQAAAVGPAVRDVAYFLSTSFEPESRRANEERLVADYHTGLVGAGVAGYGADRCWDDYRLAHLQGPLVTILGCMYATGERTAKSDAMFLAMARRSYAAITDLRSLELL